MIYQYFDQWVRISISVGSQLLNTSTINLTIITEKNQVLIEKQESQIPEFIAVFISLNQLDTGIIDVLIGILIHVIVVFHLRHPKGYEKLDYITGNSKGNTTLDAICNSQYKEQN